MAAHAGEKAEKTGVFHCAHCSETVHVKAGETIPECPRPQDLREPHRRAGHQGLANRRSLAAPYQASTGG